jgi:hypothetical protein
MLLQKRIRENRARMQKLGVAETARALLLSNSNQTQTVMRKRRVKKRKAKVSQGIADMDIVDTTALPKRRSKRLRDASTQDGNGQETRDPSMKASDDVEERPTKRSRYIAYDELSMMPTVVAPFSLLSERITVLDLGRVHRSSYANKYWSSSGCRFHHAYPVGYRATKVVFGKVFEMSIEESETGPQFIVLDSVTNRVFRGDSPTSPWTQVCVAQRTGQRISGPLFYGFSDIFTMKALAKNLYNEDEMKAAVNGTTVASLVLSAEEQRAAEFCSISGIGPKLAEILSRVDVTGTGSRPKSLKELSIWLNECEQHQEAFLMFLTMDDHIPENTRKWPQWYKTIAKKVVQNTTAYCT